MKVRPPRRASMKGAMILALVMFLAGCATTTPTYAPDGTRAYAITCNGYARSWATCFERAGEACGALGYRVIAQNEEYGYFAQSGSYLATGSSLIGRSMTVACGGGS